jgi:hypothetical protein
MDDSWRFCPTCGKPNEINDAIAGTVERWRRRVGKSKNEHTMAELVTELQTEVSARIHQLREDLAEAKRKLATPLPTPPPES